MPRRQNRPQYWLKGSFEGIYLTEREFQCVTLLSKGRRYKQIAATLNLSVRTVEFYMRNIRTKLNCHTNAELIEKILEAI